MDTINYGPLMRDLPNLDQVTEDASDGYAAAAMILMAVSAYAEANGLDPEATVAEIVDRAEAIATAMLAEA